jgi:hypothetical protein
VEAFRIICETCHSRLKIRSPEVVGEIHACPKCGSMVHIVPPAGWQPGSSTHSNQPQVLDDAALAFSETSSFVIPANVIAELNTAKPSADVPIAHPAATTNAAASSSKSLVLCFVGGAVVLLAASVAIVLALGRGEKTGPVSNAKVESPASSAAQPLPPASTAVAGPKSAASQRTAPAHPTDNKPASANSTPLPATDATAAKPETGPKVSTKTIATPPSEMPAKTAAKSTAIASAPSTAQTPNSISPPPTKEAARETKNAEHQAVLKFDPLNFDVERLSSSRSTTGNTQQSTNSIPEQPPGQHGADPLGAGAVPGVGMADNKNKAAVTDDVTAKTLANRGVIVRRGPPDADAPPRKPGQQLATVLKAYEASDVSLIRLIDTLGEMAGTPITVDPVALELAGVSPRNRAAVNVHDSSLEAILRSALANQRLDLLQQGDQVRVALPKADERRALEYDVRDLVSATDAANVAQRIEHFVAPETWKPVGDGTIQVHGTTLHIEQSDKVRRQIVIFCERLRLARNLPLRSKYPAALLSVDSPYQQLTAKLNERTTFTFLAWTRLADVFRQWQTMTGWTILVDWDALREAELGPSSPIACSAIGRSWQESLAGILEPLGLGWWAVDGQTIQITSHNALKKNQRVEFYSVPQKIRTQFPSIQALIEYLKKEAANFGGKQGAGLEVLMELDEPSGRLIVLAAPNVQHFLSQRLSSASP